jgi:sugar lactone lactonase YvrE
MRFPSLALLLATAIPAAFAQPAAKSHYDFRLEAEEAYERKDFAAARKALQSALALRPDSPRYLQRLAGAAALTGDKPAALDYLQRLAALGVGPPIERDRDLAPLQGTAEFSRILRQLAENREPRGEVESFAELPGRTGIIEGIAYRARTGDLFLGDVHHRCIWRRDRTGQVTRFSADDDELLGVFGLAIDEARNTLWAALTSVPEMSGYQPATRGQAALAEFNLTTIDLRRVIPVPGDGRDHGVGDLAVAEDGTVYLPDSKAPVIWKYVPGAEEMERVVDSPVFSSLQGIVVGRGSLLVADYDNGLFRVELSTGNIHALTPPPNTTLIGLDGLVAAPGGVVATQNGTEPQRVLRIAIGSAFDRIAAVEVLASGHPQLRDITLAALAIDRVAVIAGSGWEIFDPGKSPQPPAHTVRILHVTLP